MELFSINCLKPTLVAINNCKLTSFAYIFSFGISWDNKLCTLFDQNWLKLFFIILMVQPPLRSFEIWS